MHVRHHAFAGRTRTDPPRAVRCSCSSAARQQPAQVRKTVQVGNHVRPLSKVQPDGQSLGTADDRTCQVERRAEPALAGHDELGRHGARGLERVHPLLEARRPSRPSPVSSPGRACGGCVAPSRPLPSLPRARARAPPAPHRAPSRPHLGPRQADCRLGLVDGAVRLDAERVLAHSPAVEEGGRAVVASFRRDAHRTAAYWPIVAPLTTGRSTEEPARFQMQSAVVRRLVAC